MRTEASKQSRRSKDKGRNAENAVLPFYRRLWPEAVRTGSATGYVKAASDILGTPFHVQVKHRKANTVATIFFENKEVADATGLPTHLVLCTPRQPPLVVMLLEDWIQEQEQHGRA